MRTTLQKRGLGLAGPSTDPCSTCEPSGFRAVSLHTFSIFGVRVAVTMGQWRGGVEGTVKGTHVACAGLRASRVTATPSALRTGLAVGAWWHRMGGGWTNGDLSGWVGRWRCGRLGG